MEGEMPIDFAGHALYYSLHAEQLRTTVLNRASTVERSPEESVREDWQALAERLGESRPVLFRHVTPPALTAEGLDWIVLRVLVPGLQPMHGHHGYPFLGGPLWVPRGIDEWRSMPPHPFP